MFYIDEDTGDAYTWDGSAWNPLGGSGGITSLGGLTGATQTFAIGTSGTDVAVSSSGTVHTFNIPTASASNRGVLSTADWSTFNAKESALTFSTPLSRSVNTISIVDAAANGTTKGAATFTAADFDASSGLISIDYTNGQAASGSAKGFLTSTDWTTFNAKLTSTLANGSIFIGNGSNVATAAAVTGDITITNLGVTAIGANKILESMLKAVDSAADEECLTYEGTVGDFEWQSCGSGGGGSGWSLTGDAGTTAGTNFIGTTDDEDFVIKTNGAETARFLSNGQFYAGTATDPTNGVFLAQPWFAFDKNQNAPSTFMMSNANGGTAASAAFAVYSGEGAGAYYNYMSMTSFSENYTTIPEWTGRGVLATGGGNTGLIVYSNEGDLRLSTTDYNSPDLVISSPAGHFTQPAGTIPGAVGIGVSDAQSQVHVRKNQDAGTDIRIENIDTGGSAYAGIKLANDYGTGVASIRLHGTGNSVGPDAMFIETPSALNGIRMYAATGGIILSTLGLGSDQFVVEAGTGYVGIGTNDPSSRLSVVDSNNGGSVGSIRNTSTTAGVGSNWRVINDAGNVGDLRIYSSTTVASGYAGPGNVLVHGEVGDLSLATISAKPIRFFVNNSTEAMRIISSGNVGIGDTTPASLFTVGAGDLFQVTSSGTVGIGATPSHRFHISNNTAGHEQFRIANTNTAAGSTARMGVESDGGIGQYLIYSAATSVAGYEGPGNSVLFNTAGDLSLVTIAAKPIRFFVNNSTQAMTLDSTGNFGIGDTTPDYRLDVANTGIDNNIFSLTDSDGECLHNPESGSETVSCSSDARLKTNIIDTGSALDYFGDIVVRDYDVIASGDRMTGVIAQEVMDTHPELVTSGSNGYYSVELPNQWKIVKAIQELNLKITDIENFAGTTITTFRNNLIAWFADTTNGITDLFAKVIHADRVETKELCIEDVCVTKDQLSQLLLQQGQGNDSDEGDFTPDPDPSPNPEPEPDPVVEPIVEPEPVVDPVSEPEPDPAPEPPPEPPVSDIPPTE